jgi:hypothetical protein
MKRLRCFVAMAFDHSDTDRLYNLAIRSLLLEQRIVPIRVDRVEHQERIDQFIIDNIDAADFVIVDLTYARPSVYYEAGYAENRIPVIYTCRRDHFGGGTKAPDGYQLKIHFDLITKNIIGWSDPGDSKFVKRLRKRVTFVTQPLVRDRRAVEEQQKQIEEFRAKPLSVRLEAIAIRLREAIRSHGFDYLDRRSVQDMVPEKDGDAYDSYSTNEIMEQIMKPIFPFENRYAEDVARHVHKKTLTMVFATVVPRLTPTDLKRFRTLLFRAPSYDLTPAGKRLEHLIERYIICSTSRLDIDSAMNKLHEFSRQGDLLTWTTTEKVPVQRPPGFQESYNSPHQIYVFVRRRKHGSPMFRIAEPVRSWQASKRKAVRLREIPRTLIFSLIGGISGTEEVVQRVSSAITTSIASQQM